LHFVVPFPFRWLLPVVCLHCYVVTFVVVVPTRFATTFTLLRLFRLHSFVTLRSLRCTFICSFVTVALVRLYVWLNAFVTNCPVALPVGRLRCCVILAFVDFIDLIVVVVVLRYPFDVCYVLLLLIYVRYVVTVSRWVHVPLLLIC